MEAVSTGRWVLLVVFFAILCVELVIAWRQHTTRPLYRWKDSIESWCLLVMTGAISGLSKLFLLAVYVVVLEHCALRSWGGSLLEYALAFLAYDFIAYAFHRASHRVGFLWAIHIAHHSSEQFNMTTAMRTAPLRNLVDWPTLLPLALFAVPPWWVMMLFLVHIFGQYWIHAQWVPKLGPIGWVVNTPSHHRVHHGCQLRYRDANFGANLIVFDRLFGTFVPETELAVYGVTRPIDGWSPLRSVFEPFADVWRRSRGWPRADRVRVWLFPPGWAPDGVDASLSVPPRRGPRRDFELRSLSDAVLAALLASVLLLGAPSSVAAPMVTVAHVGFGLVALHRVARSLSGGLPSWGGDVVLSCGLTAAGLLAPVHAGFFAAAACVSTGMAAGGLLRSLLTREHHRHRSKGRATSRG